jgi:hypothetical protein
MPTVKELIVQARAAGIRYSGLNKAALEEALRTYHTSGAKPKRGKGKGPRRRVVPTGIDPLRLTADALRHFDCDQVYALTGVIPLSQYDSRLEAAKNGHFACVKMMDEKGIDVPRSEAEHLTDNIAILVMAWNQGDLDFIDWALNRSGDRHYVLPPNVWQHLAEAHDYRTLASAINNYGKWTKRQEAPYHILTQVDYINLWSNIMRIAIADLPRSKDFLFWVVSPKTNPKYHHEFASDIEWIDVMVSNRWFDRVNLENLSEGRRQMIIKRMVYLITIDPNRHTELISFLKARNWLPKKVRDKF